MSPWREQVRQTTCPLRIIGGLALAGFGYAVSGPSTPNFGLWLVMPCVLVAGGVLRLLRRGGAMEQPIEQTIVAITRELDELRGKADPRPMPTAMSCMQGCA